MTALSAATATAAAAPVATAATAATAAFGLEQRRAQELQEIASRITGLFEGWGPRTRFKLDNGQVWQVSDDSSGVYYLQSPKVKVQRALLGDFTMEIEGAKRAPRVRRIE